MKNSLLITLPLVAMLCSCGGSNPEHDTMMAEHRAQMSADSAKHAEMEQMKQTTQRFLDLWFTGEDGGHRGDRGGEFRVTHPHAGCQLYKHSAVEGHGRHFISGLH